ncbi:MAG TPA: lysophospholipid acyltransferase family protein [Balneolales bacterium]|nr:lysophospholipid acyltransferase family protein [Balneolales bacterium]
MLKSDHHTTDFIPSAENRAFSRIFGFYVKWLFKVRFKNVWIQQEYQPASDSQTVYFINHTTWWDGIIPLLLNEYIFHQKARAMMEDKQLRKYPFFKYIGAFSVNKTDPLKAIASLRYAMNSLQEKNTSLFIYPEGKLIPEYVNHLTFEPGIGWLYDHCPNCDFVPITISILMLRGSQPDLFIKIGQPVKKESKDSNVNSTSFLEQCLTEELKRLHQKANTEKPAKFFRNFF